MNKYIIMFSFILFKWEKRNAQFQSRNFVIISFVSVTNLNQRSSVKWSFFLTIYQVVHLSSLLTKMLQNEAQTYDESIISKYHDKHNRAM